MRSVLGERRKEGAKRGHDLGLISRTPLGLKQPDPSKMQKTCHFEMA
jgi:hypothetical protein